MLFRSRKHVTSEESSVITTGFGRSIEWRNRTSVYYPKEPSRLNIVRDECEITGSSTCPSSSSSSREQHGWHTRRPRGRLDWFWQSIQGICRPQSSCALPRPIATACQSKELKKTPECLKGLSKRHIGSVVGKVDGPAHRSLVSATSLLVLRWFCGHVGGHSCSPRG